MWKKIIICSVILVVAVISWNFFVTTKEYYAYKKFYEFSNRKEALEEKKDSLQALIKKGNKKSKELGEILAILSEPLTKGNEIVQYEAMLTYIKMRKDDSDVDPEEWERREKAVTKALEEYKGK